MKKLSLIASVSFLILIGVTQTAEARGRFVFSFGIGAPVYVPYGYYPPRYYPPYQAAYPPYYYYEPYYAGPAVTLYGGSYYGHRVYRHGYPRYGYAGGYGHAYRARGDLLRSAPVSPALR